MKINRYLFSLVFAVILIGLSTFSASAQGGDVPPFDWSTAVWSDQDGGYCNPGSFCVAPRDAIPPTFGQYCTTAWCSFPTWALGYQLGLYGGIGTGGGACDYSTDCYVSMVGTITPPPQADCLPAWPICSILYGGTPTPPPPPTAPPNATTTPTTEECPLNLRVSQQPPAINASKSAPAYPIVVGQDQTKRGVDVSASIQVYPAIVKYDVPKYEHECQFVGGTVTDSACQNQVGWKNKKVFAGCETKTEVYPDHIAFATLEADLAPESIAWITTDLAAKYPGAHVYQAHWSLWPGRAPSQGGMSSDSTSLNVLYQGLPLADPGTYRLQLQGATTGTPYTQPRSFSFTAPNFDVHLLESTIIK